MIHRDALDVELDGDIDTDWMDVDGTWGDWDAAELADDRDADWDEPTDDLNEYAELLRDALREDLADIDAEALEDALDSAFESMSAAEAFNFGKALQQLGRSASRVVADPAFARIAGRALPAAGGALGTAVGGPLGAQLGLQLGTALSGAIPGRPGPTAAGAATPGAAPAPTGSAAALMALLLGQQKDGALATLAAALGEHGRTTVNGVPVASVLQTMSSLYGKAAAEADELMFRQQEAAESVESTDSGDLWGEGDAWSDRAVYTALMDAEDDEAAEALGAP